MRETRIEFLGICQNQKFIFNDGNEQIRIAFKTPYARFQLISHCMLLYLILDTNTTTLSMYDYQIIRMYNINSIILMSNLS